MANLTYHEKITFERLFGMPSGYVLDFTNRTFEEFVFDSVGKNIFDDRYMYGSGSKANMLRGFWKAESNHNVGKLLSDLLDYYCSFHESEKDASAVEQSRRFISRLLDGAPIDDVATLHALAEKLDLGALAKSVKAAIDNNTPESGLDRLHTFLVGYLRRLCKEAGIVATTDKPLHSIFGEYVKHLQESGLIETEMSVRILKSSISTLEAFNNVRNNRSLAHDNPPLGYEESLLIYKHTMAVIQFLDSITSQPETASPSITGNPEHSDELPF